MIDKPPSFKALILGSLLQSLPQKKGFINHGSRMSSIPPMILNTTLISTGAHMLRGFKVTLNQMEGVSDFCKNGSLVGAPFPKNEKTRSGELMELTTIVILTYHPTYN